MPHPTLCQLATQCWSTSCLSIFLEVKSFTHSLKQFSVTLLYVVMNSLNYRNAVSTRKSYFRPRYLRYFQLTSLLWCQIVHNNTTKTHTCTGNSLQLVKGILFEMRASQKELELERHCCSSRSLEFIECFSETTSLKFVWQLPGLPTWRPRAQQHHIHIHIIKSHNNIITVGRKKLISVCPYLSSHPYCNMGYSPLVFPDCLSYQEGHVLLQDQLKVRVQYFLQFREASYIHTSLPVPTNPLVLHAYIHTIIRILSLTAVRP